MLSHKTPLATAPVKDLQRARRFYEDVLDLTAADEGQPGVVGYRAGASTLLVYESKLAGTNQATAVTWPLGADFDAVYQALKAKGVAFERYEIPGVTMDGDVHVAGDMRLAWFKDPDGNIIHIGSF